MPRRTKSHMMDESEQEPEAIPAEPMEETQAAGSTQEIVLPQELMQEEQSAGNTQEIVLPTEETQENRNRQTKRKIRIKHFARNSKSVRC